MNKAFILIVLLLLSFYSCKEIPNDGQALKSDNFTETHRPKFHFTPAAAWMNDPNGMYYLEGTYHLSYQYYPDSTVWGPMHWGHASSKDLVSWEEQAVILYPDSLGYIFSGSAVVDTQNTSGFGSKDSIPVVAAFTHHDPEGEQAGSQDFQYQSLAYSIDKGYSWTKYEGNPVLKNNTGIRDFRDPKLIWHSETSQWIMALAVYDRVQFYGSVNLKQWQYLSEFGIEGDTRLWECPDLFPLKIADGEETKWVLIVSIQQQGPNGGTGTSYFIGDFDGTTFTAETNQQWLDWGADNYAFVTWDNAPLDQSRRLGIGWMSNWQYAQEVPTKKWRSAMTVPRELTLHRDDDRYYLKSLPVEALRKLRSTKTNIPPEVISNEKELQGNFRVSQSEMELLIDLDKTTSNEFGITFYNEEGEALKVAFYPGENMMQVDRQQSGPEGFSDAFFKGPHTAPLQMQGGVLDLQFLSDVTSLELFALEGALNFTDIFFPSSPYSRLKVWSKQGDLVLKGGTVYGLNSFRGYPQP
ncbi:glycoside hydrolase family 32 protein [Robiginitalea sp. IMCC43444]|uniref:glycoside hydrolase family 32 protein n=1 Tax=Robiginitalea sp. IMCC43444 TaxID=3459121 RepID=UPI0040416A62